ncbi:hypothetical protein OI25_7809 (plasmid) [Paraburkholderia fungorum]|uniref:Uncharacterized protein n=1 Tax=Paraburkholderia fungorum TaxID=134537 RepID=A0AAU8T7P2_9BURK|nr:hypothetical protein OI25_7809 [Paraburkholderia fungorum]
MCVCLAVADRCHLWVGEHHGGHRGEIEPRVTACHVDCRARAGRRRDVDKLRQAGAVAGRMDVGRASARAAVDHDAAALVELHARTRQVQAAGVRRPSRGNQQPVRPQLAVVRGEDEFAIDVRYAARLRLLQHDDALRPKGGCDGFADGRVFTEKQGVAREDGDAAAQTGEGLSQLDGHHRRADHGQALRDRVACERLGGGPVLRVLQAWNRRGRCAGASGNQAAVERYLAFATGRERDGECMGTREARFPMQHTDVRVGVQNAFVFGVAQFVHARLLLGEQARPVDRRCHGTDAPVERARLPQTRDMGRADHDLRRHTADVDTRAAEGAALDQRHVSAVFCRLQRSRHRGAPAADHGNAEPAGHAARLFMALDPPQRIVVLSGRRVRRRPLGQRSAITKPGHCGGERIHGRTGLGPDARGALRIRHCRRDHTGYVLQCGPDRGGTRGAGHPVNSQFGHPKTPLFYGQRRPTLSAPFGQTATIRAESAMRVSTLIVLIPTARPIASPRTDSPRSRSPESAPQCSSSPHRT